jgi:hypothetical protein
MKVLLTAMIVMVAACAEAHPSSSIRPLWHLGRQVCTASSINERMGLWLTANHCVNQGLPQVEDRSVPELPFHQTSLVWFSEPDDLAVLFTASLRVTALRLGHEPVAVGGLVQSYGFPLALKNIQYVRGYVSSRDTHITSDEGTVEYGTKDMFGMNVCAGASGSAILNEHDEIVSVVQIGTDTPCGGITGGARFSKIRYYLERFFEG